jgi:DNA-binding CsgD family transcriptional regulator/DNA polymerase III delta prime subunit
MALPPEQPILCPVMIGRDAVLDAVHRLLEQTKAGNGQTALLAGEAGVGKSRLLKEIKSQATQLGLAVMQGNCVVFDSALPYAPLLDLLRLFFASQADQQLLASLGPDARELSVMLPGLAPVSPDFTPTPLEPEQGKRRLFEAMLHCFFQLAARQPLLIAIEDLHWSDESSLEWLLFLARRLAARPILLLLSYRPDEMRPGLRHFLATLDRERLAAEYTLEHLTLREVEAMVRACFARQRPVRQEFLESLYALTEGNPFFIEEILKSVAASEQFSHAAGTAQRVQLQAAQIPRTIQDAVQQRLDRLSQAARDLLALAAVAGRRFDFALLQHITGRSEAEVLNSLKEMIAAQLVVEESADHFAFRHALTRQAIYAGLLLRERKALHRVLAEAIEHLYASARDTHLEDLAAHWYEAGVWDKAAETARRAGERAQRLYAPQTAIEHFTRALEATAHLGQSLPAPLYRSRGLAYHVLGDFERGLADLESALRLACAAGDQRLGWQTLLDLGLLWAARDYQQTGAYYRQALTLARAIGAPEIIARSLNWMGNWHMNLEQPLEGRRCHQEALALFETLNDQHGLAETLDLLGMASGLVGDLRQSIAYYERAVALFRALDDRQGLVSSLTSLAARKYAVLAQSKAQANQSLDEAPDLAEEAARLAKEIGWRAGEAYALMMWAFSVSLRGDYRQARALLEQGLATAEEIEHHQWMTSGYVALGTVMLDLFALPEAGRHLERALALAREIGSAYWMRMASGILALALIEQKDFSRAEALLDAALSQDAPAHTAAQHQVWYARAELALARGDAQQALAITDHMLAPAAEVTEELAVPHPWKARGEALAVLQRWEEAEQALLTARAKVGFFGGPPLWRIDIALGRLYRTQGRQQEAEAAFATARKMIETIAASFPDDPLSERFLQRAAALLPPVTPISARRRAKQSYSGLTEREREVAALIAQGCSNREIASTLVIGPKTVEAHISHILTKLGFSSRAQIAAWAVDQGLAEAPQSWQARK